MNGVVSLLPQPFYGQVEQIWQRLEDKFGLNGVKITPYPHFSWMIGEEFENASLVEIFHQLCQDTQPFSIYTSGLGIFTGLHPVIFIHITKSPALHAFHLRVWAALKDHGRGVSDLYHPDSWVPHITLATADISRENIGAVMAELAFQSYTWEITLDNLAYIDGPAGNFSTIGFSESFLRTPR